MRNKLQEILSKKNTYRATTVTKDDLYGSLTQKDSEKILEKIKSFFYNEETVIKAYSLMDKKGLENIEITNCGEGLTIFADNMPHCLGSLILKKEGSLVTRMYDADFGSPFETELTATHFNLRRYYFQNKKGK